MSHNSINELSSDHKPVLQLGQAVREHEEPWTRQTVSWPAFVDHLSANIGPITAIGGPIDLETAVRQVTKRVSDSLRYATNTSRAVNDRAFIPREARDLIREKNRLRRQWQRTLNPESKAEYNRMARRTKVALDEFRNNRWGDFMVCPSETPSEFWKAVKVLKRQRVPVPPIHRARGVAFTTENKAEAFAEILELQCSPVYENVDRIGRIHRQVRGLLTAEEDEGPIRPTSPEEVKAIVKSFRPNKALGPDGITYCALKHAPRKKQADVAMIPKPGESHNWPQNYRPISFLPVMGKIADRIILTRLRKETDDLDVIAGCQFGFCREDSTSHQVLRLVEHIKEGFNRRECTGAVFLYIAKGFDKVWHQGLLLKMHRAGISKAMVKLIHSFLCKRTFKVKLEGRRSTVRIATAGVSDLTPAVQHLHQRHPDKHARQPGDTALDTLRDWYVENRRPSPEKHGRAFRDRRSPKKEVRQRARTHLPRRHHSLATRSQILGSHARFPGKLGSPHTPRGRSRMSDVGNPLSDDGGTREAPRVGVPGVRPHDPLEVRPPTITHRGQRRLAAEQPAC
ncbi:hypothetical protein Trydic_g16466 [Trypoxylus dichotomus]